MNADKERLRELGFLKPGARQKTLAALCHAGKLHGGLSISLSATPDEVLGGLCAAMGGTAQKLKLEDVRGKGPFELHVRIPAPPANSDLRPPTSDLERPPTSDLEKWEVDDVAGLAHNLNDLFRSDQTVRACAVLGEWEDMLQLWCVDRLRLLALLQEQWFEPRNAADLAALAG